MREMVFRERVEKVAGVRAVATIVARVLNSDADRLFGDVIASYASEVFQEGYDPDMLRQKMARLREAQSRVRQRRLHDLAMMRRLERMDDLGEAFEERTREKVAANPLPSNRR